ncbi:MAG: hemolysin family protein [Paracoccaceae bacterium]
MDAGSTEPSPRGDQFHGDASEGGPSRSETRRDDERVALAPPRADAARPDDDRHDDHRHDGSATEPADPEGWSLGRWVRNAFSNGNGEHDEAEDEEEGFALGPAFRQSTDAERAMVVNILRMRELRVSDVMTPRADIVAVPEDADLDTVMAAFSGGFLSRVPVYRETLDDPIGFVHLKDLALIYGVGCQTGAPEFRLANHVRAALFVPPSMRIAALLQKMQGARVHMALVIDEFGGVDGLVTIEDLVEQIVGDIEDEHDEDDPTPWREEAPGVWLVNARADIAEFEEAAGTLLRPDDWEEEVDTLGGLVFMLTGRVPVRAEVIAHPEGHEFQVIAADPRRIKRLRLTLKGARGAERRTGMREAPREPF